MGDQLRADLGRIHDLVRQLSQLRQNLIDAPARFDEIAGDMGNKAIWTRIWRVRSSGS